MPEDDDSRPAEITVGMWRDFVIMVNEWKDKTQLGMDRIRKLEDEVQALKNRATGRVSVHANADTLINLILTRSRRYYTKDVMMLFGLEHHKQGHRIMMETAKHPKIVMIKNRGRWCVQPE